MCAFVCAMHTIYIFPVHHTGLYIYHVVHGIMFYSQFYCYLAEFVVS